MEDKSHTDTQWKKPIKIPIGVYVWIVLIIIKFGILNFIGYFWSISAAEGNIALPFVIISFGLCFFTVGAAIWAGIGQNEGRISLMILVPLNILWLVFVGLFSLLNDETSDDQAAVFLLIQQIILSIIVIGFEWYFMSDKVIEYYKQND